MNKQLPGLAPTHCCNICGALWRQCDDGSWNLRSDKADPCCDNAAMGDQISPLVAGGMTPLPPELEALMPEPAFKLTWRDDLARYFVSKPNIGNTDVFTADQVRQAMLDATERAAKLAAGLATDAAIKYAGGYPVDFDDVAAAIRGGGQGS